jgi:hypothetical protein
MCWRSFQHFIIHIEALPQCVCWKTSGQRRRYPLAARGRARALLLHLAGALQVLGAEGVMHELALPVLLSRDIQICNRTEQAVREMVGSLRQQ